MPLTLQPSGATYPPLASIDEAIAAGYGRSMVVGAFSTGIVGGSAGTTITLARPEWAVAVPAGYVIRPIRIEHVIQGGLGTTDSDETETLIAVDSLGMWTGDGTFTSEIPSNLRSDLDKGSLCRCGSAFITGDMTTTRGNGVTAAAPVLDMELARVVETFDAAGTAAAVAYRVTRLLYEPDFPPFLVGPCTLIGYWGGTRATIGGFALVQWIEAPASALLPSIPGL